MFKETLKINIEISKECQDHALAPKHGLFLLMALAIYPFCFFFFFFLVFVCVFVFLEPHPWHMKVPRLRFELEL